jgi:chemotaxis protein CheY-P-specific phosphatase CheC
MNVDTDSLERLNLLTRDAAERASDALADAVGASTHIGATKIMLASRRDIVADLLGASEECLQFELDGPLSGTVLVAIDQLALDRIEGTLDDPDGVSGLVDAMMGEFVTDWESHLGGELTIGERTRITDPRSHEFSFEVISDDTDSTPIFQSTVHWLQDPGSITLYLAPDRDALERLLTIDDDVVEAGDGADEADAVEEDGTDDASSDGATADTDADDPFGGASDENDPFGESETDDGGDGPFGASAGDDDPFGASDDGGDDPFATADGGDTVGRGDAGGAFANGDDDAGDAFGASEGDDPDGDFGMGDDGGSLFGDDDETVETVPLDKLSVFSDLTREGTTAAADRVTQMTGIETETEIAGVSFTPIDDISGQMEEGDFVGTTVEFEGTPSGHLVILFREESAANIAEAMMPMEPEGEGLTSMHESAIEELCNIMTSGFIDGWANVLQTSVEHTPPEYVDNMDMALMEIVTEQLGPFQTHAYTIESRMKTDEIEFDCEIHALPNEAELSAALEKLMVDRKDETQADPSDLF